MHRRRVKAATAEGLRVVTRGLTGRSRATRQELPVAHERVYEWVCGDNWADQRHRHEGRHAER
ncbi:MAG: hypothetical protein E6J36_00425 [Chloroflexi bacterium]|nr:MAG: hypothetical protein E6J36_00425 [Chloroflexota bacterium]